MSERSIKSLEDFDNEMSDATPAAHVGSRCGSRDGEGTAVGDREVENRDRGAFQKKNQSAKVTLYKLHFPRPTKVSAIISILASGSEKCFVLDPNLDRPIQLFSSKPLPFEEALAVVVSALTTVGLRVVQVGDVYKIVPLQNQFFA